MNFSFFLSPVFLKRETKKNSFWFRNLAKLHLFLEEQKNELDIKITYEIVRLPDTGRFIDI